MNDKGEPVFLVSDDGTLYEAEAVDVPGIGKNLIHWQPIWSFDTKQEAIDEAELRYRNSGGIGR